VPTESPGTFAEKETTMIKRHSDVVLEVTADDPDTLENDLNAAVEMAREHAMKECRHGILVTQHGYSSYTVAVTRYVPCGQTRTARRAGDGFGPGIWSVVALTFTIDAV
jgi:hypothetical protein